MKAQQEFVENWAYPDDYEADAFDMESIKTIPVTMMAGENDGLCPPERAYE